MQQAVHQTLINDIENLLSDRKGIDEAVAKQFRKGAEILLEEKDEHPLKQHLVDSLAQLRERIHAQIEKRDKDVKVVMEALEKAKAAIKAEKLKEAEEATQKALSVAGQIPSLSAQRRADIDKQLDRIYPKMRKLSAWRHWGTTHARENLIDQIKLLVDSRLDPNTVAKTLREAKKQWQDWEKSGDHSEHKLWREFSNACDAAYAPCKDYFKKQKDQRQDNLAKKRQLITDIKQRFETTDWKQPNWKEIDKWLRQTRGQFFKIGHTDYKHHKKLKADLEKALDQFEENLSRERTRSLKIRQQLIEQILELEKIEDSRDAISKLDQLKKQWIVTVLEKRGVENKLWDSYQKAQDLIYNKRNAQRKEQDQERNDNLKQKRLIVEQLIQASAEPTEALLAGQSVLAQHQGQFNEIGYVPRQAEKGLMDNWRKAQEQFKQALSNAQKTQAMQTQANLIEKAKFCSGIEQQQLSGKILDADKTLAKFETLTALSNELEALFKARLKAALNNSFNELEQNTQVQLERCLKLEVMLELPTPAEFAKAKMAFQIERLSASMKKNTQAQTDPQQLRVNLLTCGAVDPQQFDSIWARIDAILKA